MGLIAPLNPGNIHRPKFSGQAIIDCCTRLTTI